MAADMRASVVITNHDYGDFVADAVASALSQEHAPLEVIVVDDGSSDGSRAILRAFGERIRLIEQPNLGQAVALSTGVAAASGDVICLLDSDDTWDPRKLARITDTLERRPEVGWVRHKLRVTDAGLVPLGPSVPAFHGSGPLRPCVHGAVEGRLSAATSALSLRRAVARQVFPLPGRLSRRARSEATPLAFDADALLIARLAAAGALGWSLDEALGMYRRHGRQQFVTRHDLERLLCRQVEVARAVAEAVGRGNGVGPVAAYKHEAVIAAMRGHGVLHPERRRPALGGVRAALRLAWRRPLLATRQATALGFAYLAPGRWTRRLLRSQALATGSADEGAEGGPTRRPGA